MTLGTTPSPFLPAVHASAVRMVAMSQQFKFCKTVVSLSMSSDYVAYLGALQVGGEMQLETPRIRPVILRMLSGDWGDPIGRWPWPGCGSGVKERKAGDRAARLGLRNWSAHNCSDMGEARI